MTIEQFTLALWRDIYPLNWLLVFVLAILLLDTIDKKRHDRKTVYRLPPTHKTRQASIHHRLQMR